jgi:hypothetical protein
LNKHHCQKIRAVSVQEAKGEVLTLEWLPKKINKKSTNQKIKKNPSVESMRNCSQKNEDNKTY